MFQIRERMQDIIEEGREGYRTKQLNPYPENSLEWEWWAMGYESVEANIADKQASIKYGF